MPEIEIEVEKQFLISEFEALRAEVSERLSQVFKIIIQGLFGIPAVVAFARFAE